jgi:hypothetical protein
VSGSGYTPPSFTTRAREAVGTRGARAVAGSLARWGSGVLAGYPRTVAGSHDQFEFRGERYGYLYHRYKFTWLTERAVEVPIVQAIVDGHAGRRVLEVGNVLSHYRAQDHLVIDKYERSPGVLNRDVLELGGLGPFDLIVAVSTLEHVGWDERPRDPDRAIQAMVGLRSLLAPGGRLVVTVPVGYNRAFDAAFRTGAVPLREAAALRRVGPGTSWQQVSPTEVWSSPYDFLLYRANGLFIAFIDGRLG